VYIAAETLDVTISQSEAKVAGTFLLASVANQDQLAKKSDVLLQIPIWFPSPDLAVHKNAKAFWATFKTDRLNYLNDENRRVLDDVIGLQLTIGKERIECKTFSVFTTVRQASDCPRNGTTLDSVAFCFTSSLAPTCSNEVTHYRSAIASHCYPKVTPAVSYTSHFFTTCPAVRVPTTLPSIR
jgi:hypothetical protein